MYISYHYEGVRYRHYNGNSLALKIYPNRCTDEQDKLRQLNLLKSKFNDALESGWAPTEEVITIPILRDALTQVLADKLASNLSSTYKKNLVGIHKLFTKFLLPNELNRTYDHLKLHRVEEFLNTFRSSERNYINRRRCLGVFFNEIVRREWGKSNLASRTPPAKAKAVLHIPYNDDQLKQLLDFLKKTSPNLYLCCLLTYGCLLRPHREILRLKRKHITEDLSQIMLSGNENKSGKVRRVFVPVYVQEELRKRLERITDPEANIFTQHKEHYNESYFNLMWRRARRAMIEKGLLFDGQTIYSFRHTAAIKVYRKTKDPHVLQQLLQHSSMSVTLNYLRGLGEVNDERLKDMMPELW
ncbi:tyrosine-type recombinase/integrase [Mucilaginibacter aquatilis]|uniref:tyrosine-type recombinase/integrase n=1 Tax=Mucilaginibacter aquatilis TaxID=1517760 RepID=UPI0018DD013B|nr:site-specific integrase [Mucilaginibacter aquatilis]